MVQVIYCRDNSTNEKYYEVIRLIKTLLVSVGKVFGIDNKRGLTFFKK